MATELTTLEKLAKYKSARNLAAASKRLRMILYGTEGVGKTTLVGKFFEAIQGNGRLVIVYDDPGWEVLYDHLPVSIRERVELFEYEGLEHIKLLIKIMNEGGEAAASMRLDNVDVFCLDTVSAMVEDFLDLLIDSTSYAPRNELQVKTEFEKYKRGTTLQVPHWNDYQFTRNTLRPIIKQMVGLDSHVFLLAHLAEPDENNKEYRPNIPKSIISTIAREVGLMGWLKKDAQNKRIVSFANTMQAKQKAKSRILDLDGQTKSVEEFLTHIVNWSKI